MEGSERSLKAVERSLPSQFGYQDPHGQPARSMCLQAVQRAGLLVDSEADDISGFQAGHVQEISRGVQAESPRYWIDLGPAGDGQQASVPVYGERGDGVMSPVAYVQVCSCRVHLDL